MMKPNSKDDSTIKFPDGRKVSLRKTFTSSGIYDAGNFKMILPIKSYYSESEFFGTPDLRSIVLKESMTGKRKHCLTFINNNKIVKNYTLDDLITFFPENEYISFMGGNTLFTGYRFYFETPERGLFGYNTGYKETYLFDISSGEIIYQKIHWGYFLYAALLIIISFIIIAAFIIPNMLKKKKPQLE